MAQEEEVSLASQHSAGSERLGQQGQRAQPASGGHVFRWVGVAPPPRLRDPASAAQPLGGPHSPTLLLLGFPWLPRAGMSWAASRRAPSCPRT